jgi:CheY-like chemotaxis protein
MSVTSPPTLRSQNDDLFLHPSTVLIVDDNAQNVELLAAFLEALPVNVVTAKDGVEALERIARHHADLILLDIMMPRMSGLQVCRRLKTDPATRDIPILIVTALNEAGDIDAARDAGCDDFV